MPSKAPEENKRDKQEAASSLAAVWVISVDAAVAGGIFTSATTTNAERQRVLDNVFSLFTPDLFT